MNDYLLKIENWKLQYLRNSLFHKGVQTWSELPVSLRLLNNFKVFKKNLCNHFILFYLVLLLLIFYYKLLNFVKCAQSREK
jgi:hypothetical protein